MHSLRQGRRGCLNIREIKDQSSPATGTLASVTSTSIDIETCRGEASDILGFGKANSPSDSTDVYVYRARTTRRSMIEGKSRTVLTK